MKSEEVETSSAARVYDIIFYESLGMGPIVPARPLPRSLRAERRQHIEADEKVKRSPARSAVN